MGQYTGNHPRWGMIRERELIHDAKRKIHEMDKSLHKYDDAAARQYGGKDALMQNTPDVDQIKSKEGKSDIGGNVPQDRGRTY